jgi:uncharacterized protein (DUF433 family)
VEITFQADPPPLRQDAAGTLRVGASRVLLELVIHAFQDGATPEAIVQRYPTTTLADVYAVIAWYLRHRTEAEAYLAVREKLAAKVRRHIPEPPHPVAELRSRLLALRSNA